MHRIDVHGYLAARLGSIGMESNPGSPRNFSDLLDRLDRPGFVVCMHDRDKDRFFRDALFKIADTNATFFVHGKPGYSEPLFFQVFADFDDGRVLYSGCDDMISLTPSGKCNSFDRMIIGFCSPGSEDDLVGMSINHRSQISPGIFDSLFCSYSLGMHAGWIPENITQEWLHGFSHCGVHRSAGVIIKIDQAHCQMVLYVFIEAKWCRMIFAAFPGSSGSRPIP